MRTINYSERRLPVLWSGDVVVAGASLAGTTMALGFAQSGKNVALIEPRTYPGRDLFATLRPWIEKPKNWTLEKLPRLVREVVEATGKYHVRGEFPLHPDLVKLKLEDLSLEAGVKILYASQPVEVLAGEEGIQGMVIGNKSGRQVIRCGLIIDATETALVARLAGADFEPFDSPEASFFTTIEFDRVGILANDELILQVPAELEVAGDRVILHRGYRDRGHVLVELGVRQPAQVDTPISFTKREYTVRDKAVQVAAYLRKSSPAFREARLATIAQEGWGTKTPRMAGEMPAWAGPVGESSLHMQGKEISLGAFAGPVKGIWCLNEGARLTAEISEWMRSPLRSCEIAEWLAKILVENWQWLSGPMTEEEVREGKAVKIEGDLRVDKFRVAEPEEPQRGHPYPRIMNRGMKVPVLSEVDVLVVGGGSSGAVAGIVAARSGASTALVDMNPGLGGTATYGGVDSYWCGFRGGLVPEVIQWVNQVNDELGYPHLKGLVPVWKPEVKIHAFLRQAYQACVELALSAKVMAAIVEGKTVRGVVAATSLGPVAFLGKVVIDATGDGDVAAYAGAETLYGSEWDHTTMWYALHMMTQPGVTRNNFTSTVDVRNVEDYTRAILSGRRRGRTGKDHDHTTYIAPRETRHILGDTILELNDHLLRRSWPDLIYIAFSNNDIKGQISSDWMRMGLIPPHLEIEIPYGAVLPRGLENILIAGKALSTTHDSLAAVRMQADMENLGAVVAVAAVMAVKAGIPLRQVDMSAMQAKLVEMDLLPKEVLRRRLVPIEFNEQELEALIDSIDEERSLHEFSDMRLDQAYQERIAIVDVVTAGRKAIPLLEKEMEQSSGKRKTLIAQMLAIMGAKSATLPLIEALQVQLSDDCLPTREHEVAHADKYVPDQAAMPLAANLLYSVGMTRDQRALPIWKRTVDLLKNSQEEDIWSQEKCLYHYVDAICVGAERLGDPAAIPILQQLYKIPIFHGQTLLSGFQANYLKERQAYLEVVIGRALARCGSPDGLVVLINYLNDVRALLAEQAHDELVSVTGQDFGKDPRAWSEWLEAHGESLKPSPWAVPSEAQIAWERPTLTTDMEDPRKAFGRNVKGYQAIR